MNRRFFLKSMGAFLGLTYIAPTSLIPNMSVSGNTFISPAAVAQEALTRLEFALIFTKPAMIQVADKIDMELLP